MPIFKHGRAISVKSHVQKFGSDWLSLSRVIVSTNKHTNIPPKNKKSQMQLNPRLGGLHVTCNAHFRTRMSYSRQKSCVKIWFGLVEIGGMWIFRGAEAPYYEGLHVTCNAHLRSWPSYFTQKSCVKIWSGLVEPFTSYRVHQQTYIQKKKKKKHRCDWKQYPWKNSFTEHNNK